MITHHHGDAPTSGDQQAQHAGADAQHHGERAEIAAGLAGPARRAAGRRPARCSGPTGPRTVRPRWRRPGSPRRAAATSDGIGPGSRRGEADGRGRDRGSCAAPRPGRAGSSPGRAPAGSAPVGRPGPRTRPGPRQMPPVEPPNASTTPTRARTTISASAATSTIRRQVDPLGEKRIDHPFRRVTVVQPVEPLVELLPGGSVPAVTRRDPATPSPTASRRVQQRTGRGGRVVEQHRPRLR